MGLIHTPRTIYSILNGVYKRQLYFRQQPTIPQPPPQPSSTTTGTTNPITIGLNASNPHIYQARLGLLDIDYLGHMNNAAYLTHAELARWELTSYNGMLQTMLKKNIHFLVVGTTVRYRKEIRPIFGKFYIETYMCGLDERNLYMMHQFRTTNQNSRIMAQMIVQGVAVQNGRNVINPATFLKEDIGFDTNVINNIMLSNMIISSSTDESKIIAELLDRYSAIEDTMKKVTANDDKKFN